MALDSHTVSLIGLPLVMCTCGHTGSRHEPRPSQPGATNPMLGSCKECLPFDAEIIVGCDGFTPRTMADADKLATALGIANTEQLEKQMAAEDVRRATSALVGAGLIGPEEAEDRIELAEANASRNLAVADQPMPHGTGREIFPLIQADLEERRQKGIRTYGEGLTAFNGRDALQDAYQEALDLAVYLRQAIEERDVQLERNQALLAEQVE